MRANRWLMECLQLQSLNVLTVQNKSKIAVNLLRGSCHKDSVPVSAVEGLMHLAPACALWLLLEVVVIEWPAMAREGALDLMRAKPLLYFSAAAMGFLVNSLAYVVIQTANSLTLKVLGTVKNAMVVWIGVVFIGDVITGLQASLSPRHPAF